VIRSQTYFKTAHKIQEPFLRILCKEVNSLQSVKFVCFGQRIYFIDSPFIFFTAFYFTLKRKSDFLLGVFKLTSMILALLLGSMCKQVDRGWCRLMCFRSFSLLYNCFYDSCFTCFHFLISFRTVKALPFGLSQNREQNVASVSGVRSKTVVPLELRFPCKDAANIYFLFLSLCFSRCLSCLNGSLLSLFFTSLSSIIKTSARRDGNTSSCCQGSQARCKYTCYFLTLFSADA
jgi:hypothetical protein